MEGPDVFDNVEVVGETARAIAVVIDGKPLWCPKSAVHEDSEVWLNGHEGTLVVAHWWAEKEELV